MATDEIAKGVGVYSSIYCLVAGAAYSAGPPVVLQAGLGAASVSNCNVDASLTASKPVNTNGIFE